MWILANFDASFEWKISIGISVLMFITLMALASNSRAGQKQEDEQLLELIGQETDKNFRVDVIDHHKEELPVSPGGTSIIGRKALSLMRRASKSQHEPSAAESDRIRMRKETLEAFTPKGTLDDILKPIFERLSQGEGVALQIAKVLPQIQRPETRNTLRDLLALSGEIDMFEELLRLAPELKDEAFCIRMDALYVRLLDALQNVRAPETKRLWQRCRDALKK